MVDIHSHILPEVDDGPKTWDVSVEMCRRAAKDGITHMVGTPHANERYAYDREKLQGVAARLQELVGDALKIGLGCDFHLSYENIQDAIAHPTRYVINNTRYLLVEFSNYGVPQSTSDSFHRLGDAGMTPIITHPERNPILRENLQRVVESGRAGMCRAGNRVGINGILGRTFAARRTVAAGTTGRACPGHRRA